MRQPQANRNLMWYTRNYTHLFVYLQSTYRQFSSQHYCHCCYYQLRVSRNRSDVHRPLQYNKWISTSHLTRAVSHYYKCQEEKKPKDKITTITRSLLRMCDYWIIIFGLIPADFAVVGMIAIGIRMSEAEKERKIETQVDTRFWIVLLPSVNPPPSRYRAHAYH